MKTAGLGYRTLNSLLHSDLCRLPKDIRTHSLYRDTVVAWRQYRRKLNQPIAPHTSIYGDPNFYQSREHGMYEGWKIQSREHGMYEGMKDGNVKA